MSEKSELRRSQFATLKKVSRGDRVRATQKICATLACLPTVKSSPLIASYVALGSEPDIMPMMMAPPCEGGRVAISRITEDKVLEFRLLESPDKLTRGSHGILEPDPEHCPCVDPADIDLVLTPGVAFDPRTFARLGRGKGHYDRFIAALRACRPEPAQVIGIGYELQLVSVPMEEHDQRMDGLITENGFRQTPLGDN